MNQEGLDLYAAWAPETSPWSAWAKPVLFASMQRLLALPASPAPAPTATAMPPAAPGRAWVIDLDGPDAVAVGAALAPGAWPVPLFNGVPDLRAVIDLGPTLAALRAAASALPIARAEAPPAFLLDARRMRPARVPMPGDFDNRWQVTPQDFPSDRRLLAAGVTEVVLVADGAVADDLAHVLRRWQEAGLVLRRWVPDPGALVILDVPRPRWFRSLWWRVLVGFGLRPNAAGGFGSTIPQPSNG